MGAPDEIDDGHVLLVHEKGKCPNRDDPDYSRNCMFCDGGLSACTTCHAFEGAWPDECPGEPMTADQVDAVYDGRLNYRGGAWREGECCRIRRPAEEVLLEAGYVQIDGRWHRPEAAEHN